MSRFRAIAICVQLILLVAACASATTVLAAEAVTFNRDVRPILAKNCFACHGPDGSSREAELRLDQEEPAKAELPSGCRAIVAGRPQESELIARILTSDPDMQMPPPDSHKILAEQEIETLKKWIDQGAVYQLHWSFEPLRRPSVPDQPLRAGIVNPIDAFVIERLAADDLQPNDRASRRTLIRRLSLDLVGLPPTPAEVERFVEDKADDAYERLVDRLLASPHYGERMALNWLDAARYADTHGYHIDSHREMWAWRDWVIEAFNQNMPFDRFTVEQLAGDLLPTRPSSNLLRQDSIATIASTSKAARYQRNTMWNTW